MDSDEILRLFAEGKHQEIVNGIEKIEFEDRNYMQHLYYLRGLNKVGRYADLETAFHRIIDEVEIQDGLEIFRLYSQVLRLKYRTGEYRKGLELLEGTAKYFKELKYEELDDATKRTLASYYNHGGAFRYALGDYEEAMKSYLLMYEIFKDTGDVEVIIPAITNMGEVHAAMGNFGTAEEMYLRAIAFAEDNGVPIRADVPLTDLGILYCQQGRINDALDILNKCKDLALNSSDKYDLGKLYIIFAQTNLIKGDYEQVIENARLALEIAEEAGQPYNVFEAKLRMFEAYLNLGDREVSYSLMGELEEIAEVMNVVQVTLRYNLANAMFLKHSSLYRNKQKSEDIFRELINSELDYYDRLTAFINLVDLLTEQINGVNDYENYLEEEELGVKIEIKQLLSQFLGTMDLERSPFIKVLVLYIQAYLSIMDMDIPKAQELIEQAIQVSKEYNMKMGNLDQPELDDFLNATNSSLTGNITVAINSIVHSEPRLKVLIALNMHPKLTFSELKDLTGLTSGNLGRNCDKLADAEYIFKRKEIVDDKFLTVYSLTPQGMAEFKKYSNFLKPYLE